MLYWQAVGIENVNQSLRSASLIQNGAQATISSNRHILSKDSWSICFEDSIDRGTRTGRKLWGNFGGNSWKIIPVLVLKIIPNEKLSYGSISEEGPSTAQIPSS